MPDASARLSSHPIASNGRGSTAAPAQSHLAKHDASQYSPAERWLHRISTLLFVFVTAVAGVLLVILPWRAEWMDNRLFMGAPALSAFFASGFVRGFCSGLGLLDIWIGFSAAVHYTDRM